jgi:hypothetical protein
LVLPLAVRQLRRQKVCHFPTNLVKY